MERCTFLVVPPCCQAQAMPQASGKSHVPVKTPHSLLHDSLLQSKLGPAFKHQVGSSQACRMCPLLWSILITASVQLQTQVIRA
jgi:hypothetical protein